MNNDMFKNQKKILVIATAAIEGGALAILNQFIASIPERLKDRYVLFLSKNLTDYDNFKEFTHYKIDTSKWHIRLFYDFYGYNSLIKKYNLNIELCVNFQNVPARLRNLYQIVYMHQSLPLYDEVWSIFERKQLKYWLYKNFYLSFIKVNKKYANSFVVQSQWISSALAEKIDYPVHNISVFKPGISAHFTNSHANGESLCKSKNFIYPAASYEYKNHHILYEAFKILGPKYLEEKNIRLMLTITKEDFNSTNNYFEIKPYIDYKSSVSSYELNELYNNSYCLLFPSRIESFGLPLLEAANKGLHIITVNLPYATELVSEYPDAHFCNKDTPEEWANMIKCVIDRNSMPESAYEYHDDWDEFHQKIEATLLSQRS